MATIRPFTAQRFSPAAGNLADLVAPPYDVISADEREAIGARSEYNTVWLTVPEQIADDRSKFVKYARSSSRLAQWRQEGILQADDKPSLYRYRQSFTNPVTGGHRSREALICLLKVEPYEKGVVLPHEQTFPKHKEDRLRLLEATRAHLECIYGLYEDDGGVRAAIETTPFEIVADVQTDDCISHELARCAEEGANAVIASQFAERRIWIADGHHRYETALAFRQTLGDKPGLIPEDFMMIALSSMRDPGLILLPTHRIVNGFSTPLAAIEDRFQTYFNTQPYANSMLPERVRELESPDTRVFGVALPGYGGLLLTMEDPCEAIKIIPGDASDLLKMLDVTILHEIILDKILGIKEADNIEYTRDANEAVKRAQEGTSTIAFLMNPPSVEDMRKIALGGEKMPQKSTFYYPKLLSGLVFWSLSDFK